MLLGLVFKLFEAFAIDACFGEKCASIKARQYEGYLPIREIGFFQVSSAIVVKESLGLRNIVSPINKIIYFGRSFVAYHETIITIPKRNKKTYHYNPFYRNIPNKKIKIFIIVYYTKNKYEAHCLKESSKREKRSSIFHIVRYISKIRNVFAHISYISIFNNGRLCFSYFRRIGSLFIFEDHPFVNFFNNWWWREDCKNQQQKCCPIRVHCFKDFLKQRIHFFIPTKLSTAIYGVVFIKNKHAWEVGA